MQDDAGGDCGDAVPDGEDGGRGLGARVSAGPAGRVGQAAGGGDAVAGAGDVGDGVGFGLTQPGAPGGGRPGRVAARLVVQQDVAELVRQRPDSLLRAQGRQEPDAARGPEDGAVGRGAVLLFDGESLAAREPAQRVPQARRGGAGRWRAGWDRGRRPGGLRHVPEVGDPVGVSPGRSGLVVVFAGVLCAARPGRGDAEDRDAVLALADLPSRRGPLPVIAHVGSAGPLGADEQDVREVLAGQPGGQAQAGAPVGRGAQRVGGVVQPCPQRVELCLAVVLALAGLGDVRGHHGSPGIWPLAVWPPAARSVAAASSDRRAWLATPVTVTAEPVAERLLAEPLAVLPGVGDDADGVGHQLAVLLRGLAGGSPRDRRLPARLRRAPRLPRAAAAPGRAARCGRPGRLRCR